MSAWHRAHASFPETVVANLAEDSSTALCGTRATAPEPRSSNKRTLLKTINFDFMPASEVAEFVTATLYLWYTASTGWRSASPLAIISTRRRVICCDATRDHGPRV